MDQSGSSSSTRWRMLLAPWREIADSLAQLYRAPTQRDVDRGGVLRDGFVWLQWDVTQHEHDEDVDADSLQQQLELMELLDLLARVDRVVFEEFAMMICGREEGAQLLYYTQCDGDDDRDGAHANFRFAYHIEVETATMLSSSLAIHRLMVGYSLAETSTAFREVKMALTPALEERIHKPFMRQQDRIPIRLGCAQRPQCNASWVFTLVQLAALQQSLERTGDQSSVSQLSAPSAFRVECMQISLVSEPDPTSLVLTSLARIVELGIEITFLRISTIYFSTVDPVTVTLCMHTLFAPSQNSALQLEKTKPEAHVRGVRHLELDVLMEYWTFRRFCSAIAHSQSLHTISLFENASVREDLEDRETMEGQIQYRTRWLAFALFSPYATHSIKSLQFFALSLLVALPDYWRDVVRSPHPVNYLDMAFDNATENTFVDVPRHTNIWLRRPNDRPASHPSIDSPYVCFPQSLQQIYVLGSDSNYRTEFLTVFLPGWGEAWVDCKEIGNRKILPIPRHNSSRGLSRVTVRNLSMVTVNFVVVMLSSVGTTILDLEIYKMRSALTTNALTSLLRACPAMTSLHLSDVELESMSPVFAGYETGNCRLERLGLRDVYLPDDDFQESMVSKLTDKTHACWQHLRELRVHEASVVSSVGGARDRSDDYVRLLDGCPRLCRFDVVRDSVRNDNVLDVTQRFQELNGKPINVRKAPLAIASKVAFLGVVHRLDGSAASAFSSDVVSAIFQLAAENMVRRCAFHIDRRSRFDVETGLGPPMLTHL